MDADGHTDRHCGDKPDIYRYKYGFAAGHTDEYACRFGHADGHRDRFSGAERNVYADFHAFIHCHMDADAHANSGRRHAHPYTHGHGF